MATNCDILSSPEYREYYKVQLEASLEYQDFLTRELSKKGIHLQCFSSKRYQWEIGESNSGTEIKFDMQFSETGNLYIETHEKSNPANYTYAPSGITRDGILHWIQGDYGIAFMFSKKELANNLLNQSHNLRYVENKSKTSMGYLVPKHVADGWCIAKFRFNDKQLSEIVITQPIKASVLQYPPKERPREEKRLSLFPGVTA